MLKVLYKVQTLSEICNSGLIHQINKVKLILWYSYLYTDYYNLIQCILQYCVYSLTPWCRVLLEKLTGLQLVKKFPAFPGTRRFITALTSVRHLSLSWASPIQSIYPHPTSWRAILFVCCAMFPLEIPPPGDPSFGVVYLRIVLSPEESSRT